jgi:glutamyl-Q tRNA(Asp) synthetase
MPHKASPTWCAAQTWPTTPPARSGCKQALGLPHPSYLHTPLVLGANGEKLSKQNGAAPLDLTDPLAALNAAATALGLPACTHPDPNHTLPAQVDQALADWVPHWAATWTGC